MSAYVERHDQVLVERAPPIEVPSGENTTYRLVRRITYYALDVVEVLLGIRFILLAFAASPSSPFVQFMYGVSGPFAAPFKGIFPNVTASGSAAVLEWSTLVAMAVYLLLAVGVMRLVKLIVKGGRTSTEETLEP